jgi:pimeloyl-ACP methyl ester carboxylesterase
LSKTTRILPTCFLYFSQNYLAYRQYGSGKEILLAFHGFGQDKTIFEPVAEALQNDYTVYSFDLFFHGESHWDNPRQVLTKTGWQEMMLDFLTEKNIIRFSLMGFSMGGRFVLATLEAFAHRIDELTLIAPDGVKTSFWYSLATYPGWTQKLFRQMVFQPEQFHALAAGLHRLRLVDKGLLRFAESQLQTPAQQQRVYDSWLVFRELRFSNKKTAGILLEKKIHFRLFVGRYDRIITVANMRSLLRFLPQNCLTVLESGHSQLVANVANRMAEELA